MLRLDWVDFGFINLASSQYSAKLRKHDNPLTSHSTFGGA